LHVQEAHVYVEEGRKVSTGVDFLDTEIIVPAAYRFGMM
jgi:hypothetical protein